MPRSNRVDAASVRPRKRSTALLTELRDQRGFGKAAELTEASVRAQARFDLIEARRTAGVEQGIDAARGRYEVRVEGRE